MTTDDFSRADIFYQINQGMKSTRARMSSGQVEREVEIVPARCCRLKSPMILSGSGKTPVSQGGWLPDENNTLI
jgi:hypothetical protein